MRRTLCLLAVASSLAVPSLAVPSLASAQQPSQHDDAVRHFIEGKRLRDEGNCPAAIRDLETSVGKEASIGGHYNLGICYEKTGNKKAALINYKKAEQIAKEKSDDRQREIGAQLRFFFEQTTHIRLALPQPTPPDLQVLIDGEALQNEEFEGLQIYFPPAKRNSYELRASAAGFEDLKQTIDQSAVEKKIAVTVVLKRRGEGTSTPEPRIIGTKWGPFQYLGLGLIAVGAVGATYAGVAFGSYRVSEADKRNKFTDAEGAAKGCPTRPEAGSTCALNVATRERLRDEYNANEEDADKSKAIWFTFGLGGLVAIAGGVLLIVYGPRTDVYSADPGAQAKEPPRPTFGFVPTFGTREQGLSVVGTF